MPRNGSGSYSLPVNSWNPAVNGVSATATDWQSLINDVASAVQASVSADGQTGITGNLSMGSNKLIGLGAGTSTGDSLRFEQLFSQGLSVDLAAATTVDIGAQLSTVINITGGATITSFGANYNGPRVIRFAGVCTLTNSATLVLPGGANITTAAGDYATAVPLGSPATGWAITSYSPISGVPIVGTLPVASGGTGATTASAARTNLGLVIGTNVLAPNGSAASLTSIPAAQLTGDVASARITNALNATGSAPIYAIRAWVNFNGTGTVAIRASGNVSSITDNGVGSYSINFTTAMPDANYSTYPSCSNDGSGANIPGSVSVNTGQTASQVTVQVRDSASANVDRTVVNVHVVR